LTDNAIKKKNYLFLLDYLVILLASWVLSLQSSVTLFSASEPEVDSSVWLYIASRIKYGDMPYLNSFDHKGPLLYLFEFFGLSIFEQYGPWIVDFVLVAVSFMFLYRLSKIENSRLISLIVVLTAICFLAEFYSAGNIVELFAMPFVSIACYVYTKYFIKGVCRNRDLVLFGVSFAAVLLLRVEMVAPWCIFCMFVCIDSVLKKEANNLKRYICCFIGGAAIIIVPVMVWLGLNQTLEAFWAQYIIFNINYSSFSGTQDHVERIVIFATFMKE